MNSRIKMAVLIFISRWSRHHYSGPFLTVVFIIHLVLHILEDTSNLKCTSELTTFLLNVLVLMQLLIVDFEWYKINCHYPSTRADF